jgi:uncharacterized protein YjbI with pentapeptide repeats
MLDHSSFYKLKLLNTGFGGSKLKGVDFSECDLTGSFFTDCDLDGAVFDNTNLEKADFSTAFNYSIDPERNKFKRTRFSSGGLKGLLNKYDIIIV